MGRPSRMARVGGTPRRGSARVASWIYEVMNPLIEILSVEESLLETGHISWRYRDRRLEHIRSVEGYLAPAARHILRDFRRAVPKAGPKLDEHDGAVDALTDAASAAFDSLMENGQFQERVLALLRGHTGEYPGGAVPADEFSQLMAEDVVNQIREMPPHYRTRDFWRAHGTELLAFGRGAVFAELARARQELSSVGRRLAPWLDDTRYELCEKYDVPAAPVGGSLG